MLALGVMSGTSLDGIDAALVDVVPRGAGVTVRVVRFATVAFEAAFRARLLAAMPPREPSPATLCELDRELGDLFAEAALGVAAGETPGFVASHGLTLFHRGEARETLQLGAPYRLRDALRASVVFDFRRADCAAGGHGAPLVPYVDALLFASAERDVVALNLGGIANVTLLPRGAAPGALRAWDTGPANMLSDAFVLRRTCGAEPFDNAGRYAMRGTSDVALVRELVAREAGFLHLPPPKSTGRERFGDRFFEAHGALFERLSLEDGCATLAAFSVATICAALERHAPPGLHVVASGGGTHNAAIVRGLRERLAGRGGTLVTSAEYGLDPDAKEAAAFAVLGFETLRGRPSNVPSATGALRPALLGAIAPYALRALYAQMHALETANAAE